MMVAPDKDYFLIVIHCPGEEESHWTDLIIEMRKIGKQTWWSLFCLLLSCDQSMLYLDSYHSVYGDDFRVDKLNINLAD